MKKTATLAAILAILLIPSITPLMAQAEDPDAYGDDYQAGDYGRVRFQENGVTILRSSAEDGDSEEAGSINSPLFPGDAIRTGSDQRIELQLASGTLVRVDRDSELTLQSLPAPGASYEDNAVLSFAAGALQISSTKLRDKDEFRIDTPAASVYLLGEGDFRVEVDDRGRTMIASRRGVAEVVGEGGSVLVRGGTNTLVDPGSVPDDPRSYSSFASDAFDRWCGDRDTVYTAGSGYDGANGYGADEVPAEVRPYYGELSSYGRWVSVPTYGNCWQPYGVGSDWRPYDDGYWTYGPGGYFWVSNEPWGWAPYHYGRWNWVTGFGWCWAPGRIFSGAWVSWSWGPAYVGWCPLDFWGRPVFYSSFSFGFYDPHCWTFVSYRNIVVRNVRRFAVPINRIGNGLRDHVVVTRPPHVGPRRLANAPDWRDRALREVRNDRGAHMTPISRDRTPQRRFNEVEDRLARRQPGASRPQASAQRSPSARDRQARPDGRRVEPSTTPHRPRTLLRDPRTESSSRDRVRGMYERLSRPRSTQERGQPPRTAPDAKPRSDERPQPREHARPQEQTAPPPRGEAKPQQRTAPPRREQARPAPRSTPPPREHLRPEERTPPPQQRSQQRIVPPSREQRRTQSRMAPPPREQARPQQRMAPPLREQARPQPRMMPPSREQARPQQRMEPPPREARPQPRMAPPSREQARPPQRMAPPPREQARPQQPRMAPLREARPQPRAQQPKNGGKPSKEQKSDKKR